MEPSDGKELPLFSALNLLIAAAAIIVLAAALLYAGNRIFNPGDLSATSVQAGSVGEFGSHADFEGQCEQCHRPLRGKQADLCLECHQQVGEQAFLGSGVHGQMSNLSECRQCHPDHRGREFSPASFAREGFDHDRTGFPIDARHAQAACQDCHAQQKIVMSGDCTGCHEEPAVHAGIFAPDCAACHAGETWQTVTWQGQTFDHDQIGFSLSLHQADYSGNPIACRDCHQERSASPAEYACQECHQRGDTVFVVGHVHSFGPDCRECHDGVDRMMSFDHGAVFPLAGRHAEQSCATCHNGQPFREGLTICATCHQEPEIHAGYFGLRCQMCHLDAGWQPARLSVHEFPLDHGSPQELTCETCHAGAYVEYTCYTCHDHREAEIMDSHRAAGISDGQIPDCAACHLDGRVHAQP